MAESAEQVYARIQAAQADGGRLPMADMAGWDVFPWEAEAGAVVPRRLEPPADERVRVGDPGGAECGPCTRGFDPERVVWEDEHWVLTHTGAPTGLPVLMWLHTREHLDFGQLDDELASQFGRISNRLVRIIESLPHVGRAHVNRWGDGGAHLHVWFSGRTERLHQVVGSYAIEWDEMIPPGPEDVWRADLHAVAVKLANWGGTPRA